jgi:hypothetical protein
MKPRLLVSAVLAALSVISSSAQHIENYSKTRSDIMQVQTALSHLTVIEVSEPVISVAAGSPAFKVEWRENKVFIQPTESNLATNLFIWTASQRFNYELVAAGPVETMDFAIDQAAVQTTQTQTLQTPALATQPPSLVPPEMLLSGRLIRLESVKPSTKLIQVLVRDLYESEGRLFIRYAIRNQGTEPYKTNTPQVYSLNDARYPRSLYDLVNAQLGDVEIAHLKIRQQVPLQTVNNQVETALLAPGQETMGVVAVQAPAKSAPTVMRIQFDSDKNEQVSAFLVR